MTIKERPIIFNAEMVKAILEGCKTQTRRVMKPQPPVTHRPWNNHGDDDLVFFTDHPTQGEKGNVLHWRCPYGAPGDRLWVRETWCVAARYGYDAPNDSRPGIGDDYSVPEPVWYRATDNVDTEEYGWSSPIYMPRWASRITLEVTDVRVERLFDISEEDARAECVSIERTRTLTHRGAFAITWDEINKKRGYGWEGGGNWWVWAITFRRLAP